MPGRRGHAADEGRAAGRAEDKPGHKPLAAYRLPNWCEHPLRPRPPRAAILFPGEQNQYAGMLEKCKQMPAVRDMLDLASKVFGFDVEEMMRAGAAEEMARTDHSQMLVYVANCAAYEVLRAQHPAVAASPRCVAGFSIGEYSALVAAEVLTYEQGLQLVRARATAMQAWCRTCEMRAVGVSGIDAGDAQAYCLEAARRDAEERGVAVEDAQVYVSHVWGRPTGVVCAGHDTAVQALQDLLSGVHGAFCHVLEHTRDAAHTPMAEAAAAEVAGALQGMPLKPPRCDVYFNTGDIVHAGADPDVIAHWLAAELTTTLRWDIVLQKCLERGVERFYECGPKRSLRDLMGFNVYVDVRRCVRPQEVTIGVEV